MDVDQIAGASAISFVAAVVLMNLVVVPAGLPAPGAHPDSAAAYFASHGRSTAITVALGPVAWTAASILGAATVVGAERDGDRYALVFALAGLCGLLLQNATFTAVIAIRLALTSVRGKGAQSFWPLHDAMLVLNGAFLALTLAGLAAAAYSRQLIGAWAAVLGTASATVLLISAMLAPAIVGRQGRLGLVGLIGWLLWVAWLLGYGVRLLLGS